MTEKLAHDAFDATLRNAQGVQAVDVQAPFQVDVSAAVPPNLNPFLSGTSVIEFTGAPGAGRSQIITGPWLKVFFNNSGQPVTVKATGIDGGVALPTGHTQMMWSDGTTVRAVSTGG